MLSRFTELFVYQCVHYDENAEWGKKNSTRYQKGHTNHFQTTLHRNIKPWRPLNIQSHFLYFWYHNVYSTLNYQSVRPVEPMSTVVAFHLFKAAWCSFSTIFVIYLLFLSDEKHNKK